MFNMRSLITILIVLSGLIFAEDGHYAVAIGDEDKDRLIILNEVYNPFTEKFLLEGNIREGDKVLEIACGIGLVSQKIASIVGESGSILATDINEEQLAIAKSLLPEESSPKLQFKKLSAYDLTSLNEKFDVVYVRFLLCHLPNPAEIIRQVKSVLKPNGRFIVEDLTGNQTFYSDPFVKGMEILRYFDQLQFEVQQSDDQYFAKLPALLEEEGFSVQSLAKAHPKLDCARTRKMLIYNLSSLKETLLEAGKIKLDEYNLMLPIVEELAHDPSIEVFSYELGQICAAPE